MTRTAGNLRNQQGFTLLEVLAAVMILALTLTALLQQFSLAQRAGVVSWDNTRAMLHAREKLEELKSRHELTEGTESGDFDDGYAWQTTVSPFEYSWAEEDDVFESLRYETVQLDVTVSWRSGERPRQVELTTLHTKLKKQWE